MADGYAGSVKVGSVGSGTSVAFPAFVLQFDVLNGHRVRVGIKVRKD
jgi:hypothetical protein